MAKIGCVYRPKVMNLPIKEFPEHFQVAEMENTFYRFFSKKNLTALAKLPKKYPEFEFVLKVNRYITHKFQFQHPGLRENALETMEKMKKMATEMQCNKFLIQPHYSIDYNDLFFENVKDFFSSIDLSGFNLFWEIRGIRWRDRHIRPLLEKTLTSLNIGHTIDLLFSKPLNFVKEGIIYTRLHGFGARWNNYLHKPTDLLQLIMEARELLKDNKEAYIIFATAEMFNDAYFLKKLWEEIGTKKFDPATHTPGFRYDFTLNYSYSGEQLAIEYSPPFAVKPEKDKIKISKRVNKNMQGKIADYVDVINSVQTAQTLDRKEKHTYFTELRKLGKYFLKYLLGKRVNFRYRLTRNNTVIIQTDEASLQYPFEMIYDGRDFACLKNNLIRKVVDSDGTLPPTNSVSPKVKKLKILFLHRTRKKSLNQLIAKFPIQNSDVLVLDKGGAQEIKEQLLAGYDIITYIGTFETDDGTPALRWGKTLFPLNEFTTEMKNPPRLFSICNVAKQKKMQFIPEAFNTSIPFLKIGSNFLTNYITLSRKQLIEFILEYYLSLSNSVEMPTALTNTRQKLFERYWGINPAWFCFSLFGNEQSKIVGGS